MGLSAIFLAAGIPQVLWLSTFHDHWRRLTASPGSEAEVRGCGILMRVAQSACSARARDGCDGVAAPVRAGGPAYNDSRHCLRLAKKRSEPVFLELKPKATYQARGVHTKWSAHTHGRPYASCCVLGSASQSIAACVF